MRVFVLAVVVFAAVLPALATPVRKMRGEHVTGKIGNTIFLHPDGTGLNHFQLGRMYWAGPDNDFSWNWDQLPEIAVYKGHMFDRLVGTSNGGATVHAFGYKVDSSSFGNDAGRSIKSLSGFGGSILREAAAQGMPTGLVNDGDLAEPGTACFTSEVEDRNESEEIVRQILDGRVGKEGEPVPEVLLAGGEGFFLPKGTPKCEEDVTLDCFIHEDQITGEGPSREDNRNLLREFANKGYEVIRTREEFDALLHRIEADPHFTPKVLGLFARDDIFNDEPEEKLIDIGLVIPEKAGSKEGRLILYGSRPNTRGFAPATGAELGKMALEILKRHSHARGKPFFLVAEIESTDNLPNNANAIGMLNAIKRADDLVGVVRHFIAENPHTFTILAADSDGGAPQCFGPPPVDNDGRVTVSGGNSTGINEEEDLADRFELDGVEGRNTEPFTAEPNDFGDPQKFAIGWSGTDDVGGGIVARAEGINSELLSKEFSVRFDNTDIYRMLYLSLFGKFLPDSYGEVAPDRGGH
mmetsp:Transcript_7334/g.21122  ORF Transcript_7334/g.21122 Transcript_7334/m.21122 type:complete len:524 (-) Transcript_7334:1096-2667(-)